MFGYEAGFPPPPPHTLRGCGDITCYLHSGRNLPTAICLCKSWVRLPDWNVGNVAYLWPERLHGAARLKGLRLLLLSFLFLIRMAGMVSLLAYKWRFLFHLVYGTFIFFQ